MHYEEFDYGDHICTWCGTVLKYVYYLKHPEGHETTCGEVCANHLSEDYDKTKRLKKTWRDGKKKEAKASKWAMNFNAWNLSQAGNEWRKLKTGFIVTIYERDCQYWWVCNGRHHGPFFNPHLAKMSAYNLLHGV